MKDWGPCKSCGRTDKWTGNDAYNSIPVCSRECFHDLMLRRISDRLDGVESRLDDLEAGIRNAFARVSRALVYLANSWAGTMPGRKSHRAREVEEILFA